MQYKLRKILFMLFGNIQSLSVKINKCELDHMSPIKNSQFEINPVFCLHKQNNWSTYNQFEGVFVGEP